MNNDVNQTKGNILEPEVVAARVPSSRKNLITVMVLSMALTHQVLGKAPIKGKMKQGDGKKVIAAIERAVKEAFPDIAPMLLGMFGVELLSLQPMLTNPDQIIKEMVAEYTSLINSDAAPNTQPNMD
jgi:hypothetical protein